MLNPSKDWTPKERIAIIEAITIKVSKALNQPIPDRNTLRALNITIYYLCYMTPNFLEANRKQILEDAGDVQPKESHEPS